MTKLGIVSALLALGLMSAQASECLSISDNNSRLECYDNENAYKPATPEKEEIGKWEISIDVSPIDDSQRVLLMVDANERVGRSFMASRPTLVMRCESNKTELFIDWGSFITTSTTAVTTRIDNEKAATNNWEMSSDNQASFAPNSISLVKKLTGKDTLLARITPYGENPYTVTFDITGLDNAIKPLREACNW